jgi:sec-independent protein translocase protein TatB
MEILGIGASELVFILLIAIIVLGPKDMQKAGRTIGRFLNQLVRSDSWKIFQRTSAELRNLPRNLMREANMELQDVDREIRRTIDPRQTSPAPIRKAADESKADSSELDEAKSSNPGEHASSTPIENDADKNE